MCMICNINDARFVFSSGCLYEGSCLIYVNYVYVRIVAGLVGFMVVNGTFNNISVISWWSVLLVEETGGPGDSNSRHQW